jgi:hypothetical protein
LKASNFGFSIPSGANLVGIKVELKKEMVAQNGLGEVEDWHLYLMKGEGYITGNDKADVFTHWATYLTWVSYGSSSDVWGTFLSVNDINSANFGIEFACQGYYSTGYTQGQVDVVRISVYYTLDTTAPTLSASSVIGLAVIPVGFALLAVGYALRARSKRNLEAVHSNTYQEEPPRVQDEEARKNGSSTGLDCMVCNLSLRHSDDIVWCPHCLSPAHRIHLLEWLHVKGRCPMCDRELNERELKHSPPRMVRPRNQKGGK